MGEFDFLEPIPKTTVQVKLPSRGIPYPKGTPMQTGKLTLTPMTMVEEAIFANPKSEDAVDNILRRCITDTIDINTLLASDKFFLFMMLRAVTYGPEYTFIWTCPTMLNLRDSCGTKNEKTVRIPDDFQMKYLSDEDQEPFKVRLKESGREIAFRLLRGFDEPEIEKHSRSVEYKRKQGVAVPDTTAAYRLVRHIVAVDGHDVKGAPEDKILAFILSLSASDTQQFRDRINYFTPGISTDVTLVCRECGATHEWDLPFTADFFRAVHPEQDGPVGDEVRSDVPLGDAAQRDHDAGSGRTPVVLHEAEGDQGAGGGAGEDQARSTPPRRVSRGGKTIASEPGGR